MSAVVENRIGQSTYQGHCYVVIEDGDLLVRDYATHAVIDRKRGGHWHSATDGQTTIHATVPVQPIATIKKLEAA